MTNEQRRRFLANVVQHATRLGMEAGVRQVREEGCENIGLMGRYERENLGLADFEGAFVQRLARALERLGDPSAELYRYSAEVHEEAWSAWIYARNEGVRRLCPGAREYGSE